MYKLVLILFFLLGCSNSLSEMNFTSKDVDEVKFDVVEKQIIFQGVIPDNMKKYFEYWFNKKVKVDGFNGKVIIDITNYDESISKIEDGKKIEISLNVSIRMENKSQSNLNNYFLTIKEFGTITGDFSMNDLDALKISLQQNSLSSLSKNINSKI